MAQKKATKAMLVRRDAQSRMAPQGLGGFLRSAGGGAAIEAGRARDAAGKAIDSVGRDFGGAVRAAKDLGQGAKDVLGIDQIRQNLGGK